MPAQQKPKKVAGARNSDRRNGKAFKKHPKANKSTGRTILGYKRERVVKWAQEAGMPLDAYVDMMKAERDRKKAVRQANRRALAGLLKGVDKMYRDGTLVHKPMPVLNRGKSE